MCNLFLDRLAKDFGEGKLRKVAKRYNYPLAIYCEEKALVYHSICEMEYALREYKKWLETFDHCATNAEVLGRTPKRGDKQIIWVNWRYFDTSGSEIEHTSVKYFCCDAPDGRLQIQLAEFINVPSVCFPVPRPESANRLHPTY